MPNLTVLYYTSNCEHPEFERRIRETLKANAGTTPIVSVSQHPIDLGTNICVGDIGASPINCLRQVLIAAEAATTPYVCTAEADFLYPPAYFQFQPYRPDMFYLAAPLYVLYAGGRRSRRFYKKHSVEAACIVGRDHLITCLKHYTSLATIPWASRLCAQGAHKTIHLETPIITFKTGYGLHWSTPMSLRGYALALPYWGSAADLVRRYCENTAL
jgi:hypothetical protein